MFKSSITSLQRLRQYIAEGERDRIVSGNLLVEIQDSNLEDTDKTQLSEFVVRSLVIANTTGKITWGKRFRAIDEDICSGVLAKLGKPLSVLDVGVSDGITAVDLLQVMKRYNLPLTQYLMTDYNMSVFVRHNRFVSDLYDDHGNPLQITVGNISVPLTFLGYLNPLQLINNMLLVYGKHLRRRIGREEMENLVSRGTVREFSLLCSESQSLIKENNYIKGLKMDVFQPLPDDYNFVRVMNVLNRKSGSAGFEDAEIARAIRAIAGVMSVGSILLVGRTTPMSADTFQTNASLYTRTSMGFANIKQYGQGSEINEIVTARN